jgi:AraC family transcriptional regulator of adaptative response / DNA-3-methyladenine glycosylase II
VETVELVPRGPYSLALSARLASDSTRLVRDGVLSAVIAPEGRLEQARAWQRADGRVCLQAQSAAGVALLRFMLGVDDDHSEFLLRFADDPLLGPSLPRLRGLRPLRTATVAHALLRALAGQLITAREARSIERRIIRATSAQLRGLHAAPSAAQLGRLAPAELARLGLGARRAAALVRICRALDLEGLRSHETHAVAARLAREPGVGPWTIGVVCLQGLGRYERGLRRDLGLVKLASALAGRRLEPEESDVLLEPYGEWEGLASVYLLAAHHAGLVGLPRADRNFGDRQDRRVAARRAAELGLDGHRRQLATPRARRGAP